MNQLFYILRGVKRTQGNSFSRPRRAPITTNHLNLIRNYLQRSCIPFADKYMLWSAVTLAFFGLLRVSEYTASYTHSYDPVYTLMTNDVNCSTNTTFCLVHLKTSKTDPFRVGCTLRIGSTGNQLCPIAALRAYLTVRPQSSGPLFIYVNGTFLTRSRVSSFLIKVLSPIHISTHSFRIGGATALASVGVPDHVIKAYGRWSSNAYQRYIQLNPNSMISLPASMSQCSSISRGWDPLTLCSSNL